MLRIMLKSKIHLAVVTQTELHYEGSISIDKAILKAVGILAGEKVEVLNLNNGERIETYAIAAAEGSGAICLNGPAARFACVGDKVIVLSYGFYEDKDAASIKPKIVYLDAKNRIKDK